MYSLGETPVSPFSFRCRLERLKAIFSVSRSTESVSQVRFTTGVPVALGASMWAKGLWRGAGVFNVEEFDPDPFLAELGEQGLPWHEQFDVDLEV